jgi:hypothetical protein
MNTLKTIFTFAVYVTLSLLIAAESSVAQDITLQVKKGDLAQLPLKNVLLEEESIAQLLSRFSFAYNIPFGFEVARGGDAPSLYRIDFKKGTLSELITQFVTEHEEYLWRIDDGVVHVFPKEDYRDPIIRELLETKIRRFDVPEKTTTMTFGENLLSTPEINRIIQLYGITYDTGYIGGFYIQQLGQRYSFHASNMKLRSILDKVVKESPVAQNWIISNDSSAQKLFLRVNVRLEYSQKP